MAPLNAFAALVNYTVDNGFQQAWTGSFNVSSLAAAIGTSGTGSPNVSAVTAVNQDEQYDWSFAPTAYSLGPESDIGAFVQWTGTTNAAASRFVIYSEDFYNFVAGGGTWSSVLGQSFAASTTIYYLDAEVAQLFSDGAQVTFAAVPEPASFAMILAGVACGSYSMWRRHKRG